MESRRVFFVAHLILQLDLFCLCSCTTQRLWRDGSKMFNGSADDFLTLKLAEDP